MVAVSCAVFVLLAGALVPSRRGIAEEEPCPDALGCAVNWKLLGAVCQPAGCGCAAGGAAGLPLLGGLLGLLRRRRTRA